MNIVKSPILWLTVLAGYAPNAIGAEIVRVTEDNASDLQPILDASTEPITVHFAPGTYDLCLEIETDVNATFLALREDSTSDTAVDGPDTSCDRPTPTHVLRCDDQTSTLTVKGTLGIRGFSIQNGFNGRGVTVEGGDFTAQDSVFEQPGETASTTSIDGGGVWLEGTIDSDETEKGRIHIIHSVFRNLSARNGGAIFVDSGNADVLSSTICGTEALESGGGVSVESSSSNPGLLSAVDLTISGSEARNGGGVAVGGFGQVVLETSTVQGCTATQYGGGVYATDASNLAMVNVTLQANMANLYGGGLFTDALISDVRGGTITSNIARVYGGGIYVDDETLDLTATSISSNRAEEVPLAYGGGAYVTGDDGLLLSRGVDWTNNQVGPPLAPAGLGGGVYIGEDASWYAVGDSFSDNLATDGGSAAADPDAGVIGLMGVSGVSGIDLSPIERFTLGDATDGDSDGWAGSGTITVDGDDYAYDGADCDDDPFGAGASTIYPEAVDVAYDGIDSDCIVEDDFDLDGDASDGHDGSDCDDNNPAFGPHSIEFPYDGVDNDCDATYDFDADQDGYDADPSGVSDDCNDFDAGIHPGAEDTPYDGIDQNCAGDDDFDADGDGERRVVDGGADCDDNDPDINSSADEVPYDGVDNDCADGDLTDLDEDGYDGGPLGEDCDDNNPEINPAALEKPGSLDGDADSDCVGGTEPGHSDDDGINDYWETVYGTNPEDEDSDNDKIPDDIEWGPGDAPVNTSDVGEDLDNPIYDVLDHDSDDDGVLDKYEWLGGVDTTGDGAVDAAVDSDGDGTPDFQDTDDDNDGLLTIDEYNNDVDSDGDGVADYLDRDSDNDGTIDGDDPQPTSAGGNADRIPGSDAPEKYGFGCSSAGGPSQGAAWLVMLGLFGLRRSSRQTG
jgi:MYXO-CTERM domain-containing protein